MSIKPSSKSCFVIKVQNYIKIQKMDNISFERVEQFKYRGTTLTNQISIEEKIKSRLNLGNSCYHSV
jgi:hypothetical protein